MNSWEQELKQRRLQEIDQIEKSYYTLQDIQKAQENLKKAKTLSVIEKAFEEGKVSEEKLNMARNKAGVYADTIENRKKGIVGMPYQGGM